MTLLYHNCGHSRDIRVKNGRKPLRLAGRCPNCNKPQTRDNLYTAEEWGRAISAIERRGSVVELLEPNAPAMALMARREAEAATSAPAFKVYDARCGCLPTIHKGPHWLYMLMHDRKLLSRLLESNNVLAFLKEAGPIYNNAVYTMRSEGMTEQETIWAFLARTGWDPRVIMELRAKYDAHSV